MRVGERGVPRLLASNSFNADEVTCLHEILTTIMRGGDPRILVRSEAARSLMRKANTMKQTLDRLQIERAQAKAAVHMTAHPFATGMGPRSPNEED